MRYFMRLSYMGSAYHGWQFQPNGKSIQEVLEHAFSTILQCPTPITGAGRTDAGVHARNYVAHFDMVQNEYSNDVNQLIYKINTFLAADIVVHNICSVPENAHARFDASSRSYQYYIITEKDPFKMDTAWLRRGQLDLELMNKACDILKSYTDFSSFAKLHADTKTNICLIMDAKWFQSDELVRFEITADRFLRNMVRAIVGTMVDIGRGKISLQDFIEIIESKNRSKAGVSVPAHGLFLTQIEYDKLELNW